MIENINDNKSISFGAASGVTMTVVGPPAPGGSSSSSGSVQPVAIPIHPLNHQQFHAHLVSPGGDGGVVVMVSLIK